MRSRVVLIAAGAALVVACETTQVDPGLGEALKYDMAIQTIDPDPVYPEDAAKPGSFGSTGAAAAGRYRQGNVKPIEREATTAGSASSGSGPK